MPKVWTASQGTIHRPSPEERLSRPSRPLLRAAPWSATSALSARTDWRAGLAIFNREFGGDFVLPENAPAIRWMRLICTRSSAVFCTRALIRLIPKLSRTGRSSHSAGCGTVTSARAAALVYERLLRLHALNQFLDRNTLLHGGSLTA